MSKRECIAIKKGRNGWNAIVSLPQEYRFHRSNKKRLKELENHLSIKDGRDFYDVRIDPKTWLVWIKKKEVNLNIVVTRE